LARVPVGAPDEKVVGTTVLNVDLDLSPDELDRYDSEMRVVPFDGYRTFHIPSTVLDGKAVISMRGDLHDEPDEFEGMSDEEREAYIRDWEAKYEIEELSDEELECS
jgi:hypothetical protein